MIAAAARALFAAAPEAPPPPPPADNTLTYVLAAALGGYVVLHLAWVFVVGPFLRRIPLNKALAVLARGNVGEFRAVETDLEKLLDKRGLGRRDAARAKLALGFVRAKLGRFDEAVAVTTDLVKGRSPAREALYLHAWLLARLKKFREVEALSEDHPKALAGFLDANMIVGVALLHRAREHRRNRQIDGAMACFRKLAGLNVLTEEIPTDIDDERTVLGVLALFDRNPDEARTHFEGAVKALDDAGKPTDQPRVGLLLCTWAERKTAPDWAAAEDDELGQLVKDACASTDPPPRPDGELTTQARYRRNLRLWHAVSLLTTWLNLPPQSLRDARAAAPADGTALGPRPLADLDRRLAAVSATDPAMPDPKLIAGLIRYYFGGEAVREKGAALLDAALAAGVNTPEVIALVNAEKKQAERMKNRPELLFVAIRRYLANQEIPAAARRATLGQLQQRWSRFAALGEADLARGQDDAPVSVRGLMQASREQMDGWLKRLPPAADAERAKEIKGQIDGLKAKADEAAKVLDGMADAQGRILLVLAESVFPEEQEAKAAEAPARVIRIDAVPLAPPPPPQVVRVACPKCGKKVGAKPEWVGKSVKCPDCKTSFIAQPG